MHDPRTLKFYAEEAQRYAAYVGKLHNPDLDRFLSRLPAGASVLELGCGGGRDTAKMLALGFDVMPTDGSPEMAREASLRLQRPVRTLLFEQLEEIARYDGVWASACLLHISIDSLTDVLVRVHRALRPGGWFYASYKAGKGEGRDAFGRYYSYPAEPDLVATYASAAGWSSVQVDGQSGSGYDDQPTYWLAVLARA